MSEYATLRREGSDLPVHVRVDAPPPEARGSRRPVVVLVHGFKGFMHWAFFPELARRLAERGLVAVSYNASHNGVSASPEDAAPRWDVIDDDAAFARNTHALELADLALVRAWVAGGGVPYADPARLGLFGHSRGGGIAVLGAARELPAALAAFAAIDDVDRVDAETKARWRAAGHLDVPNQRTGQVHRLGLDILDEVLERAPELDVLAAAARVACPALLVHGTADDAVPPSSSERLAAAMPNARLERIPGAGHAFGATHPLRTPLHEDLETALELAVAHFARHLGAASARR